LMNCRCGLGYQHMKIFVCRGNLCCFRETVLFLWREVGFLKKIVWWSLVFMSFEGTLKS
jgi:hypothetical protein